MFWAPQQVPAGSLEVFKEVVRERGRERERDLYIYIYIYFFIFLFIFIYTHAHIIFLSVLSAVESRGSSSAPGLREAWHLRILQFRV